MVAANVVLPGGLTALPTSISWIRGATSRREKEKGKGRKEGQRKGTGGNIPRYRFLVSFLHHTVGGGLESQLQHQAIFKL